MAVLVQCQCGKRFSAREENRGKKARCAGCGATLVIGEAAPVEEVVAAEPAAGRHQPAEPRRTVAPVAAPQGNGRRAPVYPGGMRRRGEDQGKSAPRFAISPKAAIFLSLLVLVPTAIVLVKAGPVKAMSEWQALEKVLGGYTSDAVMAVLRKEPPVFNADGQEIPPRVTNVMLDGPIMMWTLPADIKVQGTSTEGHFYGVYHTRSKTFDLEVHVKYDSQTRVAKAHVDEAKAGAVLDEVK